jgi:hypothetical protein
MIYLWLLVLVTMIPTIIKDRNEYIEWSKK